MPRIPISSTRKSVSACAESTVRGSPNSLLKLPGGAIVAPHWRSTCANKSLVDVLPLPSDLEEMVRELISKFFVETGSEIADALIKDWSNAKKRISLIMPRDYAKVLAAIEKAEREGLPVDKVVMEAVNG